MLSQNDGHWIESTTLQTSQNHVNSFLEHVAPYLVGSKKEQANSMVRYFREFYIPPGEAYWKHISKHSWFKILELSESIFRLRGGKTEKKWENYEKRVALIRRHVEEKEERAYETPARGALIDLYWN